MIRALARRSTQAYPGLYSFLRRLEVRIHCHARHVHDKEFLSLKEHFRGGTIADVGANLGQSLITLHSIFPTSPIVAFEPNPACWDMISRVERCIGPAASVHPVGLGKSSSTLPFYVPIAEGGAALLQEGSFDESVFTEPVTVSRIGTPFRLSRQLVPIKTLDEFEHDYGLIKIDVQGLELDVLLGAQRALDRCHPLVFFERNHNDDRIHQLLSSLGYLDVTSPVMRVNRLYRHCSPTQASSASRARTIPGR